MTVQKSAAPAPVRRRDGSSAAGQPKSTDPSNARYINVHRASLTDLRMVPLSALAHRLLIVLGLQRDLNQVGLLAYRLTRITQYMPPGTTDEQVGVALGELVGGGLVLVDETWGEILVVDHIEQNNTLRNPNLKVATSAGFRTG